MKVILDTNFWSYIANSSLSKSYERLEHELKIETMLPPSILLEVLRTKNPSTRIGILGAMNKRHRTKLRTEADLEAEELVREIRRLRPNLLRKGFNTQQIRNTRRFWTREIWKSCISDHENLHKKVSEQNRNEVDQIIDSQKKQKVAFAEWDIQKVIPSEITVMYDKSHGLEGFVNFEHKYEGWRVQNAEYYRKQLKFVELPLNHNGRTVADWCEPWIKIDEFLNDKMGYYDFWLEEVRTTLMPRNYVRWAIGLLQPFRKISEGNAFDEQHGAYLTDVDIFFTCDRRFYNCLEVIKKNGVINIAKPVLLPSDIEASFSIIKDTARDFFTPRSPN